VSIDRHPLSENGSGWLIKNKTKLLPWLTKHSNGAKETQSMVFLFHPILTGSKTLGMKPMKRGGTLEKDTSSRIKNYDKLCIP
jgi:hypothetical protein